MTASVRGGEALAVAKRARDGLTPGRRRALVWLADHPHSTLKECAADLGVTRSAVHYFRISLSALGLIEKGPDLTARTARLTAAGYAALGRPLACPTCNRPFTHGENA